MGFGHRLDAAFQPFDETRQRVRVAACLYDKGLDVGDRVLHAVVEFGHEKLVALGCPLAFLRSRVDPAQDHVEQGDAQVERGLPGDWGSGRYRHRWT